MCDLLCWQSSNLNTQEVEAGGSGHALRPRTVIFNLCAEISVCYECGGVKYIKYPASQIFTL